MASIAATGGILRSYDACHRSWHLSRHAMLQRSKASRYDLDPALLHTSSYYVQQRLPLFRFVCQNHTAISALHLRVVELVMDQDNGEMIAARHFLQWQEKCICHLICAMPAHCLVKRCVGRLNHAQGIDYYKAHRRLL